MSLEDKDFERLGEYVKEHISDWLTEKSLGKPPLVYEIELRERMVRVEEELKHQRELMQQGFEMMEKRFEAVDRRFEMMEKRFEDINNRFEDMNNRFEDMNKRFTQMMWFIGIIFIVLSAITTLFKFIQ